MNSTPASQPQLHRPAPAASRRTPLWRDERVVRLVLQGLFLLSVGALCLYFYANVRRGLAEAGLTPSFRFLSSEAGFGISEGIRYAPSDSYGRALWVGAVNTVRVSAWGIALATGIGLVAGIARLSSNWLVRSLAGAYIELFRNIPLLLQLLFWYSAVFLKLPPVRQSVEVFGHVFLNQRGLYVPRLEAGPGLTTWLAFLAAGAVAALAVYLHRRRQLARLDRPGFPVLRAAPVFLLFAAAGWFLAPLPPLQLDLPRLERFNFAGGARLSPEFAALLLGLSVYTGAFIAEVVRGGIQAVDKGQREAALALGLRPAAVTFLIVLPQAVRVIVPPLTNQYLNLAKNSSLAVAIGYPDLFNIGTTTMNQTGQTIPLFLIIMAGYLSLSLITSAFMNWYNRRVRLIQR